jgi:hypothetical protein
MSLWYSLGVPGDSYKSFYQTLLWITSNFACLDEHLEASRLPEATPCYYHAVSYSFCQGLSLGGVGGEGIVAFSDKPFIKKDLHDYPCLVVNQAVKIIDFVIQQVYRAVKPQL